jgi:tetratricopeptide (TPR) repeat protein
MDAGDRRGLDEAKRLLSSGKLREAFSRLLHLTEKYPDDAQVREGMAEALVMQGANDAKAGEYVRAIQEFRRSIGYRDTAEAHINLGRIYQVQEQYEDAFAEYSRALDLNEDLPAVHEALGRYFLDVREFDQAANAFGRAIAKGGGGKSVYLGIWEAFMGQGRYGQAHDAILEAVNRWPQDDSILGTAALSWAVARNDHEQAQEMWKRAVAINPKNLPALFNLAGLAALRGDRAEALSYIRKCAQVDVDQTKAMWRQDAGQPRRRFAAYAGDEDFLDALCLI